MQLDAYGYGPNGRKPDPTEHHVRLNLTRCWEWWHRLRGPSQSEIDAKLKQARRDAFIRNAEKEQAAKDALIERLNREMAEREVKTDEHS